MSTTTQSIAELERRYLALLQREEATPNPSEAMIRETEEAYHAMADAKENHYQCLRVGCRERTPWTAYCERHEV